MRCSVASSTDAIFIVRQLQENHLYNSLSYMCAKFQLHSPKGFWEENFRTVFFFLFKLPFMMSWQLIKFRYLDKIYRNRMGNYFLRNISEKCLNICSEIAK